MPFASMNPTNPRTNPKKFKEKILRIGGFEKLSFERIYFSMKMKSSSCSTLHHFLPYFKLAVMILRHSPLLLLTNTTEVEGKIPQLIKVIRPKCYKHSKKGAHQKPFEQTKIGLISCTSSETEILRI